MKISYEPQDIQLSADNGATWQTLNGVVALTYDFKPNWAEKQLIHTLQEYSMSVTVKWSKKDRKTTIRAIRRWIKNTNRARREMHTEYHRRNR